MDNELKENILKTLDEAKIILGEDVSTDFNSMDPVAKMMLVALMGETQKIRDDISRIDEKIAERFYSDFIPWSEVQAMPAMTLLKPSFKKTDDSEVVRIGDGAEFSMKATKGNKSLNFIPIFKTNVFPFVNLITYSWRKITFDGKDIDSSEKPIEKNVLFVGITTNAEVESLRGLTLMLKGFNEIPISMVVGTMEPHQISFSTMKTMEHIEMAPPCDSQQFSQQYVSMIKSWKQNMEELQDMQLIFVTDNTTDRDLFKSNPLPKNYSQWMEEKAIMMIKRNTLWLRIEFPDHYVIPQTCDVELNVFPVVNINVHTLDLNQKDRIKKIESKDGTFVGIVEPSSSLQKHGYSTVDNAVIVRDFDARCYDNAGLERDIRNLYNRFKDDYQAFADYTGINDNDLNILRKTIAGLRKSTERYSEPDIFSSGIYVMKKWGDRSSIAKVTYITTAGKKGNEVKKGSQLSNKNLPTLNQEVEVLIDAMGGKDKITIDERREQLRYFTLTNDRLYTKMDIDAFLRKEIMKEFGKTEFDRIFLDIHIEGTGGERHLQRGLYINLCFKDVKNFKKANDISFAVKMQKEIIDKSCIAMPIVVKLINLEDN